MFLYMFVKHVVNNQALILQREGEVCNFKLDFLEYGT